MSKSMVHHFNGKKYTIQRVSPEALLFDDLEDNEVCYGICSNPQNKDRSIKIDKTVKGKFLLELELHEFLHASKFCLPEKEVDRMGKEISDILWRMGYRKTK